ncbi:MAG TPA: hypothetical protein VMP86_01655 [Candidatus Binatia bacterium]|nr:hypothetical protein [Candidatus Binatia bacterium]
MSVFGLAVGALAVVGGTALGGEIGPLAAGYGLLATLAALYALAGLAIRERVWRRLWRVRGASRIETVASHRVF